MTQLQGVGLGTPKLTEPNPNTNALKTQEPLSEQANAEKHELTLKTMQKCIKRSIKRNYKDSVAHRKTLAKSQNSN